MTATNEYIIYEALILFPVPQQAREATRYY